MTPILPYQVTINENEVVIRADRTLFAVEELTTLLDALILETIRRRSQVPLGQVQAPGDDVKNKV